VLLTTAGWIIGLPLGFVFVAVAGWIIGVPDDSILLKLGLDNAAAFVCIVAVVGLMQWLALRRIVRRAGFWVLSSIIGFTISSSIHGVVCYVWGYPDNLDHFPGTVVWAMAFVVGGTLAGVLQQRILRRHVRWSAWWVPASVAGWGLSMIGLGIPSFFPPNGRPFIVLPLVLASVLLGIVTGGTLIWLLRQPTQQTAGATIS
jgi:hypothetical protein